MRILVAFVLLFGLFSCGQNGPKESIDAGGGIHYYARLNTEQDFSIQSGQQTIIQLSLEGGSSSLYLIFNGALFNFALDSSYSFPSEQIEAVLTGLDSTGFVVNRNLSGSFQLHSHEQFKQSTGSMQLKIRLGLEEYKELEIPNFQLSTPFLHAAYLGQAIRYEETFDSLEQTDIFPLLQGQWRLEDHVFFDGARQQWRDYFHLPDSIFWQISDSQLLVPMQAPLYLEERRLSFDNAQKKRQYFAINKLDSQSLWITNLNVRSKDRYFFRRQR
ncbi:hypothetical protein SapgrDRAFT_0456 [Saprospira grandis DSM 2844]|uniref:Lipoprotein n=1 Tax=Saprospira grandis DSM 2844 TaxID=694433 RepID=J0XTG9_9BACT|nr:hypothetical protein [Saprospira grandis]EJF52201.1 hypothetical protein SapgrDRAFT_0456 [Saprospira grandis DSM 2844]